MPLLDSIFWLTTSAEDFCFTRAQANMRDPREDTTHNLLILLKVCLLVPSDNLSSELHILAHNFIKHFCFTRDHAILETPETKQGSRTLETTQVLGSPEAMLAPKSHSYVGF